MFRELIFSCFVSVLRDKGSYHLWSSNKGFVGNDLVAFDGAKSMHANGGGFAGIGAFRFEGENFAAIAAAFRDSFFEASHELAGECEAGFARWHRDFDDDSFAAALMGVGS